MELPLIIPSKLPYFTVHGHGDTIPTETIVIPPDTYLIRFSNVGINIEQQEGFKKFVQDFIDKKIPDLFETHNTSLHKTNYGIQLEQSLYEHDNRIKLKIHLPGETTSDANIQLIDPDPTLNLGIFKNNQDGMDVKNIAPLELKNIKLSDLITLEGKGVYILIICREINHESIQNNLLFTLITIILRTPQLDTYKAIDDFLKEDTSIETLRYIISKSPLFESQPCFMIDNFMNLLEQAKSEYATISDLPAIIERELKPHAHVLTRQRSEQTDVKHAIVSNPALHASIEFPQPIDEDEDMDYKRIKSFINVTLRSDETPLYTWINNFLHSDSATEQTLIDEMPHIWLPKSQHELHILIEFLKKAKVNHIPIESLYDYAQTELIQTFRDIQRIGPVQEVDGGQRRTQRKKCKNKRKQKNGGTIKLNKREKYYAKYGFTKKRNRNLNF